MPRMSDHKLEALDLRSADIESLVDATPDIDPWCSGPDWILPAHAAFAPESEPLTLWREGVGAALLARYTTPDDQQAIAGLEPLWGFASPILGAKPDAVASFVASELASIDEWHWLVLPGLPQGQLTAMLAPALSSLGSVAANQGMTRQLASLREGSDVWFGRRSSRFRQTMRRAWKQAGSAGLTFVDISVDHDAFERCVAIEQRSWKGQADDGITSPHMHRFYELMTERLIGDHRLRATVAQLNGRDVGFVFGGIRGSTYRGLQLSYDQAVHHLSVSHLLQHHTMKRLEDESTPVDVYDLGMDMDYKRRWADMENTSVTLVVERSR